jgi:PilZ domain
VQERRRHPRTHLEIDIRVRSDSAGIVPGWGIDISDSEIAAILPVELKIGETVDLEFKKYGVAQYTRASVRQRNVFRHGFQFLTPIHPSRNPEFQEDCETCSGTGSIYKPLDKDGIATMRTKCSVCNGTGRSSRH